MKNKADIGSGYYFNLNASNFNFHFKNPMKKYHKQIIGYYKINFL